MKNGWYKIKYDVIVESKDEWVNGLKKQIEQLTRILKNVW